MTINKKDYATPKREWRKAWRAVKHLIDNPEETDQVFIILRALAGKSFRNAFLRFKASPVGARILAEEIDLFDTLVDREYLKSLPEGSLGREYLDFITRENISPEGLVDASSGENSFMNLEDPEMVRYGMRGREMHDLWHVVTGYGRDGLGEASIVAASYVYSKNLGMALIAVMAGLSFRKAASNGGVLRSVFEGYRNARKTEWLLGSDWENLMPLPLREVRQKLNIQEPTRYRRTVATMDVDALYTQEVQEQRAAE
jgi:ubiquinone biosynthesis protein COQ4